MTINQVVGIYYKEQGLKRIKACSQKDTITVAQLFLKVKGEELIKEENMEFA